MNTNDAGWPDIMLDIWLNCELESAAEIESAFRAIMEDTTPHGADWFANHCPGIVWW